MTRDSNVLPVVPIPGLRTDSLGHYLASLGLLRLLARNWVTVRIGWHEHGLYVVGGPTTIEDVLDELMAIAEKSSWTSYDRGWVEAQKKSTQAKSGAALALWQASASEDALELLTCHVVPAGRVSFNPLLGSGGNAGKRAFADGWKQAIDALATGTTARGKVIRKATKSRPTSQTQTQQEYKETSKRNELRAFLVGGPITWMLEKLNAASWFSDANKLYNSGQQPFREGQVSPWAMALACEGLAFMAGGASRRLGVRARAAGAFPFVTRAAAPSASGESGHDLAEIWAPLWERPMTVPEVRALFARGRAEVGGRGVLSPSAFAAAILRRGVDAGISEFRRFVLGRTTSAHTFEPRFEGSFCMPQPAHVPAPIWPAASTRAISIALGRVLGLIDRLPHDRKVGQRWRFVGLRGQIEATTLQLAITPEDPEKVRAVLDAIVDSLDRVDRNRNFREKGVSWQPMPIQWLPSLFVDQSPVVEARLALALISGFPVSRPFTLYRFGVVRKFDRFEHPERPPERWVWRSATLPRMLAAVLRRRMLDWELARSEKKADEEAVRFGIPAWLGDISLWLNGAIDERLLARWISRLALFDWSLVPSEVRTVVLLHGTERPETSAALGLFGLFQPFFDKRPVISRSGMSQRDLFDSKSGARTPAVARTLTSLLTAGHIDTAVRFANTRYAMAGARLARTDVSWRIEDPERLLASVLFHITEQDRSALIERWLRPQHYQGETIHA